MVAKKLWHCVAMCFISSIYAGEPAHAKAIQELKNEITLEIILAAGPDKLNYTLRLLCTLAQLTPPSFISSSQYLDAEKILLQNEVNPCEWTTKIQYLQRLTQKENPFE